MSQDRQGFWQRFDEARWRGELLDFGPEVQRAGLRGLEYDVAKIVLKVEAGTVHPTDPEIVALADRLHGGPADHASRAGSAYAQANFFVGNWQNCLDGLHMAAVTALRGRDARGPTLRRLRTEAYLRLADLWLGLREPRVAAAHLSLASVALERPSARISARLRLVCSGFGAARGALLQLAESGRREELRRRIADRHFDGLPPAPWPPPPDPDAVARAEGRRAAYELCLAEARSVGDRAALAWAEKAVAIATRMGAPGWTAAADLVLARIAARLGDHQLAAPHVYRALDLVRASGLDGLMIPTMLANLPLRELEGNAAAREQSEQVMVQVLGDAAVFRDPVLRRRFLWAHEEAFAAGFRHALAAGDEGAALLAVLNGAGWGWRCAGGERPAERELLAARRKETGPLLPGERRPSMRRGVFGPGTGRTSGSAEDVLSRVEFSDSLARAESLQLVRERALGAGHHTTAAPPPVREGSAQVCYLTRGDEVHRITRWRNGGMEIGRVAVAVDEIRSAIRASGLSVTFADRPAPVDLQPIAGIVRRLTENLPEPALETEHLEIWAHGLLHQIPFGSTLRASLPRRPAVSAVLTIERRPEAPGRWRRPARLAPVYDGAARLACAEAEVRECARSGDLVASGRRLTAEEILRAIRRRPSLFHFAGHAVNRNDLPELAGLYDSDSEVVSVSDILNLGYFGPGAVVLSACETGPGALHSADGSYSLPRAFLQAGAEWVVASLWRIGDAETLETMKAFFDQLARGVEPERALPAGQQAFVVYRPAYPE